MREAGTQRLLDRADIEDVLMLYFNAVDRGDKVTARRCFTEDVIAQYEGRPEVRGVDKLLDQIALFENLASGACRVSTHFAGNLQFKEIAGDHAEIEVNAFAFLVNQDGKSVAMRSLRYLDRLRRVDAQWKISERLHTLDWSCDVPCTFARPIAQKLTGFPAHLPSMSQ
jgi:hypothetical protein